MRVIEDESQFSFRARRSEHNWADIFNGQLNLLVRGEDYKTKDISMKSKCRAMAKKLGYAVSVFDHAEGIVVKAVKDNSVQEQSSADFVIAEQQDQEVAEREEMEFSLVTEKVVEEANNTVDHTSHLPKKGKNAKRK